MEKHGKNLFFFFVRCSACGQRIIRNIFSLPFYFLPRTVCVALLLLWLVSIPVHAQTTNFRTQAGIPGIPVLSSAPTATSVGGMYANSTDRLIYKYNGTKWMPIGGSITANILLTSAPVLYKGQTLSPEISYLYSGGVGAASCGVSGSTYVWYRASDANGTGKTVISSGTGSPAPYTVVAGDVGQYIGLGVTPTTACNVATFEVVSWKPVSALTPSVALVNVAGLNGSYVIAGRSLTASFSGYACAPVLIQGDVGANCTYQWYYADDASGSGKTAISGKTASSYTVSFSDGYLPGKYVAVGVIPVATNGATGTEKISTWYQAYSLVPSYSSAAIVGLTAGKAQNKTTLTALKGTYSVSPAIPGTEGSPIYKWYYATDASGAGKTAIVGQTTQAHTVDVGAGYGYNATTGYLAVGITPVATTGETGTEVLSSWVKVQLLTAPDGTPVYELVSPSGRVWMDRNLGASQAATSNTDYLGYGSLYQWCRAADGHQLVSWTSSTTGTAVNGTTTMLSATTTPGHSLFIKNSNSPNDWISPQLNDGSLWWNGSTVGSNTPCPAGYHVPTYLEWASEQALFASYGGNNAIGAYNMLKLNMAGDRWATSVFYDNGSKGFYWSSTTNGINAYCLFFDSSTALTGGNSRADGFCVRCIKD
jgi:Fibrobacter succinogenes major domain (Fib_succ_major).